VIETDKRPLRAPGVAIVIVRPYNRAVTEDPSEGDELPNDPAQNEPASTSGDEETVEASGENPDSSSDVHRQGAAPQIGPALDLSKMMGNLPDLSEVFSSMSSLLPDLSGWAINLPNLAGMDFSDRLIPAISLSGLIPEIDYAALFPRIEIVLPHFDISALIPKITFPDFGPGFAELLEDLRKRLPPNWPVDVDIDRLVDVIQNEGIPLVWVPRSEVVGELLVLEDRMSRVQALVAHGPLLMGDCRDVLADVVTGSLAGQVPLALKAVDAFESGHPEAAQALAVVVTETAVAAAISGKYEVVKKRVLFDPDLVPYTQLRLRAALAPIGPFYTTWYANSGKPVPDSLSRHVTVHQASSQHYTIGNSIVAILLATSVLRALQELQELAEASEVEE
jgi:hypothetical protein